MNSRVILTLETNLPFWWWMFWKMMSTENVSICNNFWNLENLFDEDETNNLSKWNKKKSKKFLLIKNIDCLGLPIKKI